MGVTFAIFLTEVLFIEKQIIPKDSRRLCTVGFVLFTGIRGVIEKQRWCPHGPTWLPYTIGI